MNINVPVLIARGTGGVADTVKTAAPGASAHSGTGSPALTATAA
jgi:glycogen synthase